MPFRLGRPGRLQHLERLLRPASEAVLQRRRDVRFECLTEEWRIAATIPAGGGLTEALNRRDPVPISDVLWGPVDASSPLRPAAMLRNLDPYDLVVAMAGEDCPPIVSDADRTAFRNSRISYDVVLDAPPFRLSGTVHLLPGREPGSPLERGEPLFFPLTGPVVHLGERQLRNAPLDAVLVNRSYVRDVALARSAATEAIRRGTPEPVDAREPRADAVDGQAARASGGAPRREAPRPARRPRAGARSGATGKGSRGAA